MFDGNHRSRRNVNLGSRRVRSRTATAAAQDNKSALLARTEQLRKERHAVQQREQAAKHMQRYVRGYLCRKNIWAGCQRMLLAQDFEGTTLDRHVIVLNYQLTLRYSL